MEFQDYKGAVLMMMEEAGSAHKAANWMVGGKGPKDGERIT